VLCDVPEALLHANSAAKLVFIIAGSADSFPAQSRQREANESDSSMAERSARAATRWLHGRDRQHRTQPGGEVSDQFGLSSGVGQFRKRSLRSAAKAGQSPRLLSVLGDRRSLAPYCGVLPVRSIAGYCWLARGDMRSIAPYC